MAGKKPTLTGDGMTIRVSITRFAAGATCLLALGLASGAASAQERNRLIGTWWCGQPGNPNLTNYRFTNDSLVVVHRPEGTRKVFRVRNYEFPNSSEIAVVYWGSSGDRAGGAPGSDQVFRAVYHRFSRDGRTMWQAAGVNDAYQFRRCRG